MSTAVMRFSATALLLTIAVGSSLAQQTVTWTGSGDGFDFADTANWSPSLAAIAQDALVDNYIVDDALAFVGVDVATFGGLTLTPAPEGLLAIEFRQGVIDTYDSTDPGAVEPFGGYAGDSDSTTTEVLLIDGAEVFGHFVSQGLEVQLNSGTLTLRGTGNPINEATIDFGGSQTGQLFSFETPEDFLSEHLNKLLVNGLPAIDGVNISIGSDGGVGTLVETTGNNVVPGDLNDDDLVDVDDWIIFRTNLFTAFSPATRFDGYLLGDIDGDNDNDEFDFLQFKELFEAANGAGSFSELAATPEPQTASLVGLALFALVSRRRRATRMTAKHGETMSPSARIRLAALTVCIVCCFTTSSKAVTLNWTGAAGDNLFTTLGNWDTAPTGGVIDKTNLVDDFIIDDPTAVISEAGNHQLAGGSITLLQGEIQRPAFQGFRSEDGFASEVTIGGGIARQWFLASNTDTGSGTTSLDVTIDGTGELELFGAGAAVNDGSGEVTVDILSSTARLTFLQKTATEVVDQFNSHIFTNGAAAVFGADPLLFEPGDNLIITENAGGGADNVTVSQFDPDAGRSLFVTLEISPDGSAALANHTDAPIELDLYKVISPDNNLDIGFAGIQGNDQSADGFPAGPGTGPSAGTGWEKAGGNDAGESGEAYLLGSSTLTNDGVKIELGNLFTTVDDAELLQFIYHDVERDAFINGFIDFVDDAGGLLGDSNGDGVVNTLDIDPFVLALTDPSGYAAAFPEVSFLANNDINDDGVVNTLDIDPFVALLTGGASAAIPEPASAVIALFASVTGFSFFRRR